MQKLSHYLLLNRVVILADLTQFTQEFTLVYQRNIKIYAGIDNTIEFDIKNADQKRIDLHSLANIQMNVMDASGQALPNSPYDVKLTSMRGIASVTIPQDDLAYLDDQYLRYSLTALKDGNQIILYTDTKFGGAGTIELIGNAMPQIIDERAYDTFTAEIDLKGLPIYHSSAIPARFYEAVPTEKLSFEIHVKGFIGSVWIEATKQGAISSESFKSAGLPYGSWTQRIEDGMFTGIIPFGFNIPVNEYTYFRISYQVAGIAGVGARFSVTRTNGQYTVSVVAGGTGYAVGSMIKIPGHQLGGVDGTNDLMLTVTGVDNAGLGIMASSYAVSSVTAVDVNGTAAVGSGTYLVTGENYAGVVDKIVVF